ncbi:MAG: MoxR family ATPase [Gemmatimonadetes bacterium]|nr:MoxR family ATPase [Gemmatimonadota bacterium]
MKDGADRIQAELGKLIIGQESVVEHMLLSLFVGGNSLLIGVPGLAKTLLVHTLAQVLNLRFSRIQFTPDLMPSDITGTDIIQEDAETGRRQMVFAPGPIFANIVLADEINRTPPKTQAALLEAMQEHRVTIQGRTYTLAEPFHVFATQNPIELEGTYPLPEAQLDRFMFQIIIEHLPETEEMNVVRSTTAVQDHQFEHVVTGEDLVAFQQLVRKVPVSEPVLRYAVNLVRASRPAEKHGTTLLPGGAPDFVKEWVSYGASVRAAQYLVLGGKARALMRGRTHVSFDDIRALAHPVLRHRILTNFHAESERVTTDRIIDRLLEAVPVPKSGMT